MTEKQVRGKYTQEFKLEALRQVPSNEGSLVHHANVQSPGCQSQRVLHLAGRQDCRS
jgi:hypothetical protein